MNKFSLMGNGLDDVFGVYKMGHNETKLYSLIILEETALSLVHK